MIKGLVREIRPVIGHDRHPVREHIGLAHVREPLGSRDLRAARRPRLVAQPRPVDASKPRGVGQKLALLVGAFETP